MFHGFSSDHALAELAEDVKENLDARLHPSQAASCCQVRRYGHIRLERASADIRAECFFGSCIRTYDRQRILKRRSWCDAVSAISNCHTPHYSRRKTHAGKEPILKDVEKGKRKKLLCYPDEDAPGAVNDHATTQRRSSCRRQSPSTCYCLRHTLAQRF